MKLHMIYRLSNNDTKWRINIIAASLWEACSRPAKSGRAGAVIISSQTQTPGNLAAVWRSFDVTLYIGWMYVTVSLIASRSDCASTSFYAYTAWRHRTCVRTVPVCFGVWRTSSSAVIGPQSTRRTSLQSGNRRQMCVWICRTESVELTPRLLEMRQPQSRNIQTTVKDVFVRTLLAHSVH